MRTINTFEDIHDIPSDQPLQEGMVFTTEDKNVVVITCRISGCGDFVLLSWSKEFGLELNRYVNGTYKTVQEVLNIARPVRGFAGILSSSVTFKPMIDPDA